MKRPNGVRTPAHGASPAISIAPRKGKPHTVDQPEKSGTATTVHDSFLPALYEGGAALHSGEESLVGEELAGAVGAVAAMVAGARRVAVEAGPNLSTLVAVAGIIAAGAAAMPVDPDSAPQERKHLLAHGEADLVLGRVDLTARAPLPGPVRPDESPALVLFTSGSTGRPKGVVLSRRAISANLDALSEAWQWNRSDVLVHGLPLFHVHGLVFGGLGPLRIGSPLRYSRGGLLPQPGGSIYFAVPTLWTLSSDDQLRALGGARLLVSGAAALSAETFARVEALSGHQVLNRYAMTETLVVTSPPLRGPRRADLVGPPLPGVEVALREVEDSDFHEVHVRGPQLFSGYLDGTPGRDANGWFATGDLGRWDEGGSLRLVGRRSTDLIKSAGFRVGAGEVEEALLTHPAVTEAAVAGVPDEVLGEQVAAWVVLSRPGAADARALRRHLADLLAAYKRPAQIHIVPELPRNALGKVQKRLLTHGAGHVPGVSPSGG
ncbi:AMP-binding protein [Streptomyces achromogenes]|uniref:AMP-binding protein n=1 Tax=Streptomyces achromogenes TaxID=67255 RepID=UPI0037029053